MNEKGYLIRVTFLIFYVICYTLLRSGVGKPIHFQIKQLGYFKMELSKISEKKLEAVVKS